MAAIKVVGAADYMTTGRYVIHIVRADGMSVPFTVRDFCSAAAAEQALGYYLKSTFATDGVKYTYLRIASYKRLAPGD